LQFEYDDERFYAPHEYPSLALVSTGTHDLPTTAGFWSGADIDARVRAGTLVGDDAIARERAERERVRSLARDAFVASGLAVDDDVNGATVARIANEFLAKTPAALLAVQLEDVLGETEQVNLPATTHEHPNWRTRHAVALEDLRDDPRVLAMITALRAGRGARADHFR
jgi:4-alpha-glucanotransferase